MDPASILAIIGAGSQLIQIALKARERARQTGEWTEEQDKLFDAKLEAAVKQDHWKL